MVCKMGQMTYKWWELSVNAMDGLYNSKDELYMVGIICKHYAWAAKPYG